MNKYEYNELRNSVNPLEELVYWASQTYEELRSLKGLSTGDGDCWDCDQVVEYGANTITTRWEYTWRFGGHSEGTCEIPVEAILGDKKTRLGFITDLVERQYSEKHASEISRIQEAQEQRKVEYERLKKEFG